MEAIEFFDGETPPDGQAIVVPMAAMEAIEFFDGEGMPLVQDLAAPVPTAAMEAIEFFDGEPGPGPCQRHTLVVEPQWRPSSSSMARS